MQLVHFDLRARRRALEITQGQLAEKVGCSTQLVYQLETGRLRRSKFIGPLYAALAAAERAAEQAQR